MIFFDNKLTDKRVLTVIFNVQSWEMQKKNNQNLFFTDEKTRNFY